MNVKCPLAGKDCNKEVDGYDFIGYCAGEYKDCYRYSELRSTEHHSPTSWPSRIDTWRKKFHV